LIIGRIAQARGSNEQAQAAAERAAREESKLDIA
jgi:hypothetical protein